METVKILHCADVHIGAAESFLGVLSKSRRAETLITFEKIISLAKDEGVRILLIAGDLFDSNNIEEEVALRVIECFKSIPQIHIVYCAGNHDPLNLNSPFAKYNNILPENFHILPCFDSVVDIADLGVKVYGRSFDEVYTKSASSFSVAPDENSINIMCIHGDLGASADTKYNPISSDFIANSGMDYIALGHIHKRSEIARIGSTFYAYSGCPEGQGFDEEGEKGVYIGEVSRNFCDLKFIPTAKRIHATVKVNLEGEETNEQIAAKILSQLKEDFGNSYSENLYKIILEGKIDEGVKISPEEICSRISAEVYFVKIRDNTEFALDLESLSKEEGLKGIFVRNMLSRMEKASEEELKIIKKALNLGIKAFSAEVDYNED